MRAITATRYVLHLSIVLFILHRSLLCTQRCPRRLKGLLGKRRCSARKGDLADVELRNNKVHGTAAPRNLRMSTCVVYRTHLVRVIGNDLVGFRRAGNRLVFLEKSGVAILGLNGFRCRATREYDR